MLKQILMAVMFTMSVMACTGAHESKIARVSILGSGKVLLNGREADLADVDVEFKRLKQVKGEVWYYRENPQSEPGPKAVAIIRLVVENALPVSMSTKPDFSDYVDFEGKSHPRKS
jgi:hypothetical protein